MEKEAASLKTKKILQSQNPTALNQKNKMEKIAASLKTYKIHESLNPTALNQRQ